MRIIRKKRVEVDKIYVSTDGKEFKRKDDCIDNDKIIEFQKFKPDFEKMKDGFKPELYKDFLYIFLQTFYEYPLKYKYLFFKKFETLEIFKNILRLFSPSRHFSISEYEESSRRFNFGGIFEPEHSRTRKFKEGITVDKIYDFLFNKMRLTFNDFKEEDDFDLFLLSFNANNIKAFEILVKLGLNIEKKIKEITKIFNENWWDSFSYKRDFISYLALGNKDISRNALDIPLDIPTRVSWLKAILDLDPKIRLFKYKGCGTTFKRVNRNIEAWTGKGDLKKNEIINVDLDELIYSLKFDYDKIKQKYVRTKKYNDIVKVLSTAKPEFKKINTNTPKSPQFLLVKDAINHIRQLFKAFPEINSYIEEEDFELGIIISENLPKYTENVNKTRTYVERTATFFINESREKFEYDKGAKVYIYRKEYHVPYKTYESDIKTIKFLDLDAFLNKPKELAEEILLHLNNNVPLTLENVQEIKDMNAKILETEEYLNSLKETRSKKFKTN